MTQRQTILDLLSGKKLQNQPAFSGLIHITTEGLQSERVTLYEAQHDARKMARAAASTFRLTGMPSAALPLDLCAPAEALGAELNFYEGRDNQFPQPARSLFASTSYLNPGYMESTDFLKRGRIPMICEAIRGLKEEIGSEAAISAILPGPYTLLLYLIEPGGLFAEMKREPNLVREALANLSSFLSRLAHAYREAGADFITIHDMGGSPGFIGPAKFEQFVYPSIQLLITNLPGPTVLSICGNTNKSMHLLALTGADAISVDQTNDLAASRAVLTDTLLFGNIDPVGELWQGRKADVTAAVRGAQEAGVDAIWPGCDLVPQTPVENIRMLSRSAAS
jgi:[methyl-Co(III) methanol-specific corrinoid protein]:coenzyme M methyltransferase